MISFGYYFGYYNNLKKDGVEIPCEVKCSLQTMTWQYCRFISFALFFFIPDMWQEKGYCDIMQLLRPKFTPEGEEPSAQSPDEEHHLSWVRNNEAMVPGFTF